MGANVSVEECRTDFNISVNCTLLGPFNETTEEWTMLPPYTSIGGIERGNVPGDADVAGQLILITFISVTSAAIFFSLALLAMGFAKVWSKDKARTKEQKEAGGPTISWSEVFETFVLCCSDQQIFTGAAYGITMRYYRRCVVSAYHYNMISAMLLISCATHILAVGAVRQYWRHTVLSFVRVACVGLFILMTTMFMMNQNARGALKFPTTLSHIDGQDSLLFLPAACFQSTDSAVLGTLQASTASVNAFFTTLKDSTPGWNRIQGWTAFVCIMLYYGLALITVFGRLIIYCCARCCTGTGRAMRQKTDSLADRPGGTGMAIRVIRHYYYCVFLALGFAIAVYTTATTVRYFYELRTWAHNSGWMQTPNPENETTTFGQLVPALSCAYILFGLAQVISERKVGIDERRKLQRRYSSADYISQYGLSSGKLIPADFYSNSIDASSPAAKSRDGGYFPLMAVTPDGGSTTSKWPSHPPVTPQTSSYSLREPYEFSPMNIPSPPADSARRSVSYATNIRDSTSASTLVGSDFTGQFRAGTPAAVRVVVGVELPKNGTSQADSGHESPFVRISSGSSSTVIDGGRRVSDSPSPVVS